MANIAGLAVLTATLAARTRVRWRPRTWTVNSGVRVGLWLASIYAVWGLVPVCRLVRRLRDMAEGHRRRRTAVYTVATEVAR